MLEIIAYLSGVLGVIASLIEILQFLKILQTKHKILILVVVSLATIICFSTWYLIDKRQEKEKIERLREAFLKEDANSVIQGIVITGYDNAGDYLSNLIIITGFYGRHKEKYNFEYETLKKEVELWRKLIYNKKAKDEHIYMSDYEELEGIVSSSKENIEQLTK